MSSSAESQIASLLGVLSTSAEGTSGCPLGVFARDLGVILRERGGDEVTLGDILADRSMELVKEEEDINATNEVIALTHDKLSAELTRIEAQMREHERRLTEVTQQKKLCKMALNLLVAGDVPRYIDTDTLSSNTLEPPVRAGKRRVDNTKDEDGYLQPSMAAPEPISMKSTVTTRPSYTAEHAEPKSNSLMETGRNAAHIGPHPATVTSTGLVAMLRLPDVKENALLTAIESYEQNTFTKSSHWMSAEGYADVLTVLLALLRHLPEPRPPVQIAELRILRTVLQASPTPDAVHNKNVLTMLEGLVQQGDAVPILAKMLTSVNNDVKCDVLECLTPLVCGSHALVSSTDSKICSHARNEFFVCNGLDPLVNIVICSTSEAVLERALVFLWGLLSKDEKIGSSSGSIRAEVQALGGLRAVLDLLYSDSLAILENVCMVIGYITREETSKKEIREIGGLEKITATLRHPSDSIKTKMAGAVWNCASNSDNRVYLRQLGAIPALLQLLRPNAASNESLEFIRENAAGALWNLSVDGENKMQIVKYGGIPALIQVAASSNSTSVVENISGTLWNCSALNETRPVIRKVGGIPILLSLLNDRRSGPVHTKVVASTVPLTEKIIDNVVGTLRNCAINDQTKPLIRDAGGVEFLLRRLKESLLDGRGKGLSTVAWNTLDKMASMLWILTISPEVKHTVKLAGGIKTIVKILEMSSAVCAASPAPDTKTKNLFPVRRPLLTGRGNPTTEELYHSYYSPAALQKIPTATPQVAVPMNIKEKLAGVLRNCSTIAENRVAMIEAGVVRALVAVILDCYSSRSSFPTVSGSSFNKNSILNEPSPQLKESVASALWFLSRDDKVVPMVQGGLELMCMFLIAANQTTVVLEQAAGALSSLTVNNVENREAVRSLGGLQALIQLVVDKAKVEHRAQKVDAERGSNTDTYASLNALLTIRNCTMSNDEALAYCSELVITGNAEFVTAVLYMVQHSSEESSREAALTIKNMCSSSKMAELFSRNNAVALLSDLSERTSSDAVRKAVANALQVLNRAGKR